MHLVLVFGPPAVGKMTVGHELAKITGYKLFHSHMTVEPVLDIFPFGSPPFSRLVNEFRLRMVEEAVLADLPGLIFTLVWGLELPEDRELVSSYIDIVEGAGGRFSFVELFADLDERLTRNGSPFRLAEKKSKRDLEFSRSNLLELEENYVMNSSERRTIAEDLFVGREHLRIDNTRLDAEGEQARTELADFMAELEKQALRFEDKRDALKARMSARS